MVDRATPAKALINLSVLRWARERLHLTLETAAERLHVSLDVMQEWERGESTPTMQQAQDVANSLNIPLGSPCPLTLRDAKRRGGYTPRRFAQQLGTARATGYGRYSPDSDARRTSGRFLPDAGAAPSGHDGTAP
jgi:transcriptional regulator with XRE-family HTH domain